MAKKFAERDNWNKEEVAKFKRKRRARRAAPAAALAMPGPRLVAEGDSWFDYLPGTDLIDCLENDHGYEIENFALAGDTLENMIFGTGIDDDFTRTPPTIDSVLECIRDLQPKAFLFSGGGNDVAGDEFESYLNHAGSGLQPLRRDFLNQVMGVFERYYDSLVTRVAAASPGTYIVTHGYGHTKATGKGVSVFMFRFGGPWMKPALTKKGIFNQQQQDAIARDVIDAFNAMLARLAARHPKFKYVDLRPLLDPDNDWANELHLRNGAYARAAEHIHQTIAALP